MLAILKQRASVQAKIKDRGNIMIGTALAVAPAAIKAGTSLWQYFQKKKAMKGLPDRPDWGESDYAKRLKKLSETGKYSPAAMQNIMGAIGSRAAGVAEEGKSGYYGRLLSKGMGGSVAGMSGMRKYDIERMKRVTGAEKELRTESELSKVEYGLEYGERKYGSKLAGYREDMRRKQLEMESKSQLIGGLGEAAGSAAGALGTYFGGLQGDIGDKIVSGAASQEEINSWVMKQKNPLEARKLMFEMGLLGG